MLAPVGGLVVYTFEPCDGKVDERGIASPRPLNEPVCGVANDRDGVCVRANETARESGATRCAGIEVVGTCASPMLGPRVMVYEVCGAPGAATPGLAAM